MDGYYREEFVALLNEAQFTKEIFTIRIHIEKHGMNNRGE